MDLRKLSDPFPEGDIEWRVSRSGQGTKGIFCCVFAYITARAISKRLDDVVGPENWCNTPLQVHEVRTGIWSMQVGISIQVSQGNWVTKYDVSESTSIEPAKGGFSGAMKRAGAQWGIGRYLYLLDETFAEVSETGGKGWLYARLPEKAGGATYYWKPPRLPSWALPPIDVVEKQVTQSELTALKKRWCDKFAPNEKNRQVLQEGFATFLKPFLGEFPVDEVGCWTPAMVRQCAEKITQTKDPRGVDPSVPFE